MKYYTFTIISSLDDEEWIPSVNHHLAVDTDAPAFAQQPTSSSPSHRKPNVIRQSSYPFKDQQHHFDHHQSHTQHHHQADAAAQPPSYLYPSARDHQHEPQVSTVRAPNPYGQHGTDGTNHHHVVVDKRRSARSSSREKSAITTGAMMQSASSAAPHHHNNNEQDIRPIIIRPRTYDSRFKHVLDERPSAASGELNDEDVHDTNDVNNDIHADNDVDDCCCDEAPVKHHHKNHSQHQNAIGGKALLERQYRTAEEVQLKGAAIVHHQRASRSPQPPQQNYRYGDVQQQVLSERQHHVSRSSGGGSGGGKAAFDYRENLTDREKYRESQKYNSHHQMYKDQQQHQMMQEYPPSSSSPLHHGASSRVRKSYAEPTTMSNGPQQRRDPSSSSAARDRTTRDQNYQPMAETGLKLSRSFKDKTANVEYTTDGHAGAAAAIASRNPYKEPESLPYRESIERMLKSPVMRYKSFESESPTPPAIRYQNYPDEQQAPAPLLHQQQRRQHHHQQQQQLRSGSPDTVCRVSPKDRFNNAKEKFEAMERERNYTQPRHAVSSSMMFPMPMSHEEPVASSSSSSRRHQQHKQHSPSPPQQQQQQRYSMLDGDHGHHSKLDWSSEDEQQQQQQQQNHHQLQHPLHNHHQQQQQHHSHHSSSRYPAPDPYGVPQLDAPPMGSRTAAVGRDAPPLLGAAKSLGNLVRGYRHSYAEPRHQAPPLPRNSGRVGLAAVNPF